MQLNMLLNCTVMAACLFTNLLDNANAMEPEDTWNKPITHAMIQEGLETYQKYQTPQTSDLLALTQQGNDDKGSYKLFALQKLEARSKTDEEMPLLLVNFLKNNKGYMEIFEWDQALGNKNFEIVDQAMYNSGISCSSFHSRHCVSVEYSFKSTFGNHVQLYTTDRGYFQENRSAPLWYCSVEYIETNEGYRNKGIGKIGLSELREFAFRFSTSIDFINAFINNDNIFSQRTFKSNYFQKLWDKKNYIMPGYDEAYEFTKGKMNFMDLDGCKTLICPKFAPDNINSIEFNWYLSRKNWETFLPSTKGSYKGVPLHQYNQDLAKIEMELGTSLFSWKSDEWKTWALEFARRDPVNCLKCIQKVKENALKQERIITVKPTSQAPQVNPTEEK